MGTTSKGFKLNRDSSSTSNQGHGGTGGVIRNETGEWAVGYMSKLHITNTIQAGLIAFLQGLKLAVARTI